MQICLKYYGKFIFFLLDLHFIILSTYVTYSNILHSDEIDLDEYHFKNDLFNYMIGVNFDENTTKPIDTLLLFRLELNTHSISVSLINLAKINNIVKI